MRRTIAIGMGLCLLACGPDERPRAEAERVLARIGPEHFGLPASHHGSYAAIGPEARPVLEAPDARRIGSATWIDPDPEGRLHASFVLPAEVARLPDAAFSLELQKLELPQGAADMPGVPREVLDAVSRDTFTRIVTDGWTLEREGDLARVSYTPEATGTPFSYNLHLTVLETARPRLESGEWDARPGATLALAYGLSSMPGAAGEPSVRFAADLGCDGEPSRPVLRAELSGEAERRWHEAEVALPEHPASCRLELAASDPDGGPVRGALWAVPRMIGASPAASAADVNVLVISLDTLRADHLSGYGYPRTTSPGIDAALIARGTTFTDLTSTYSRTDVSHMSMLSGLYPAARPDPERLRADTPLPLLAEGFATAGYETVAFAEDGLFAGSLGFWYGFDRFTERAYVDRARGVVTFAAARAWLRSHASRRFFLFVHSYKTHAPYAANEAYSGLFRDPDEWKREGMPRVPARHRDIADEYDRTIREADDLVVGLLEELASLGLSERTLVVLTSDHGEAFGEHGVLGHSYSGHQEVLRVPLVLRGPGVPAGLRIDTPVSQVDIVPTLLELAGLEPFPVVQGLSLVPALRGQALRPDRPLYFSWKGQHARGLRYGPWKFRDNARGGRLFDMSSDPAERRPIAPSADQREIVDDHLAEHAAESAAIRDGFGGPDDGGSRPAIPEHVEDSLRALGYIE